MREVFVQAIGIIATICIAVTYLKNKKADMLMLQFAASILFAVHYLLLSAYTGALLGLLVAIRCLIYFRWDKNKFWVVLFMVIFGVSGVLSWQNIYSILPAVGSILFSWAFWLKSPKQIRLFSILPSVCWGLYGIVFLSIGGILTEIICLSAIVLGYLKHDYKKSIINIEEQNKILKQ